jgi:phage-related minor tail protein
MEINKENFDPETIAFLERSQKIRADLRARREEPAETNDVATKKGTADVQKSTTETLAKIRELREKIKNNKSEVDDS